MIPEHLKLSNFNWKMAVVRRMPKVTIPAYLLEQNVAVKLDASLVFSRREYCNAVLAVLPNSTIAPLQRVQNAAACLVERLGPRDHASPTLKDVTG